MSILWCGGEDVDFPTGTPTYFGGAETGYTRYSINLYGGPGNSMSTLFPGGGVTSCWLGWRQNGGSQGASVRMVGLGDSDNRGRGIWMGSGTASGSSCALFKYDGTTQTNLVETSESVLSPVNQWALKVTSYGVTGQLDLYQNGVLLLTYSGDISVTGVTHFDCVLLGFTPNSSCYIRELIVADEDLRAFRLVTLAPDSAGDANAWTGAYSDIDETVVSDTDLAYSNTGDADMQVNVTGLPTGVFSVKAVMASARAYRDASSTPDGLALGIRNGTGGSLDYGTKQTLTTSWTTYNRLMTTNPVTAAAWAVSEIAGLQLNLRAKT